MKLPKVSGLVLVAVVAAVMGLAQDRQQARARIDVQTVALDAQINPTAQTLNATAKVTFIPLDNTSTVTFELNNALNLTRVTDVEGRQITASRFGEDMSVRLSLPQVLPKGKPATLTFVYEGKLTGQEESPVFGIKFAAITPDVAYLMYPARWFPVNDYTADRFASDFRVTVPDGYRVVASGIGQVDANAPAGMHTERYQFERASFPGSIAVVRGDPDTVSADGVSTKFYVRKGAAMAQAYGAEIARAMDVFHRRFRTAGAQRPDRDRNRGRRAQRLRRSWHYFPRAQGHGPDGQHEAGGQRSVAAVVGRAGFARDAQPYVD